MIENINTRKFWNYKNLKDEDLLLNSKIYRHKHKLVLNWIDKNDKYLLNVGIGNGYLENLLISKNKSIKLYGIDISDRSIIKIKKRIAGIFKVANATSIPFKGDLFDVVVILDVLEHLKPNEFKACVGEIKRVLKSRGKLIISVPLNEKYNDRKSNRHIVSFSKKSLFNKLTKLGFSIQKSRELFAFKQLYWIKTFIVNLFLVRKPNLIVVCAIKK